MHRKKSTWAEQASQALIGLLTMIVGLVTGAYALEQLIAALHTYGVPAMSFSMAFSITTLFLFQLVGLFVAVSGLLRMGELTRSKGASS